MRPGQLHQLEAGALVLRAGRAAGLLVRTEHRVPVQTAGGRPASGEIDICWFCPKTRRLLVAWEIDGHDAGKAHFLGDAKKNTAGNQRKFEASGAAIKVQVLYSVKNDLTAKDPSKRDQIATWLSGVELVTDEELMDQGGNASIEHWMARAWALVP